MFFFSASVANFCVADKAGFLACCFPCANATGQHAINITNSSQLFIGLYILLSLSSRVRSLHIRILPGPHSLPGRIEDSLVVPFAELLACLFVQQVPKRTVLVVNPEIVLLICRRDFIGAEQETIGI